MMVFRHYSAQVIWVRRKGGIDRQEDRQTDFIAFKEEEKEAHDDNEDEVENSGNDDNNDIFSHLHV